MDIDRLLSQAPWRLRAYWASGETAEDRVGWRAEPGFCPLAEWLDYEQSREEWQALHLPSIWSEEIIFGGRWIATPPLLSYFVDLIDAATMAPDEWHACTGRITRQEALAALRKAERRAAQWQLQAPRCAFPECQERVVTPQLHGFLCQDANAPIVRQNCWPFAGGLCEQHIAHLIFPPPHWWPAEFEPAAQEVVAYAAV